MTRVREKMKRDFLHQEKFFSMQHIMLIFLTQQVTPHIHVMKHADQPYDPFFCKISFDEKKVKMIK